jgi:hypothetical protein
MVVWMEQEARSRSAIRALSRGAKITAIPHQGLPSHPATHPASRQIPSERSSAPVNGKVRRATTTTTTTPVAPAHDAHGPRARQPSPGMPAPGATIGFQTHRIPQRQGGLNGTAMDAFSTGPHRGAGPAQQAIRAPGESSHNSWARQGDRPGDGPTFSVKTQGRQHPFLGWKPTFSAQGEYLNRRRTRTAAVLEPPLKTSFGNCHAASTLSKGSNRAM